MSRCIQILSTCSPLQRLTQANKAIFNGVQSLQLRLSSSKKKKHGNDPHMSDQCKHKGCSKMGGSFRTTDCSVPPRGKIDEDAPGCMPFTDCDPIKPFYECEPPKEMKKCGKNKFPVKKPKSPCDPNHNKCK